MMGRMLIARLLLGTLTLLASTVGLDPTSRPADSRGATLDIAYEYPDGGGYVWKDTGVPEDLVFDGQSLLKKSESGTFCCGFTLAVAFRVGQERDLFAGKSFEEMQQFYRDWYGMKAGPGDPLIATAMENLGVGEAVDVEQAHPGDYLQFWRDNGSGHSVIFLAWVEEGGERVGFRYRSSQTATDGIGDHEERFAGKGGKVKPDALFFARFLKHPGEDGD